MDLTGNFRSEPRKADNNYTLTETEVERISKAVRSDVTSHAENPCSEYVLLLLIDSRLENRQTHFDARCTGGSMLEFHKHLVSNIAENVCAGRTKKEMATMAMVCLGHVMKSFKGILDAD